MSVTLSSYIIGIMRDIHETKNLIHHLVIVVFFFAYRAANEQSFFLVGNAQQVTADEKMNNLICI